MFCIILSGMSATTTITILSSFFETTTRFG
nr:MAG TPA: hypothetical protein [Caudoviricetes sp.]